MARAKQREEAKDEDTGHDTNAKGRNNRRNPIPNFKSSFQRGEKVNLRKRGGGGHFEFGDSC